MTDKHSKDMTASELLREADSHPCSMCRLVMNGDESCATTGCASWAYRLADKIDAELAKARELSLRQGAELWAKANGWPDFREGEDFGAWLERCALPRPRFDDGEVVDVREYEDILGYCVYDDGDFSLTTPNREIELEDGERVKRPAPEVLGTDGLPLNEDDTVYGTGREQHRYTVQVPYSINEEVGKRFCVQCYDHDEGNITWCDPSMLTHERPVLGADGKPVEVGETVYPTYGFYAGTSGKVVSVEHQDNVLVELCCSTERFDGCYLTHTPPDTQQAIDDDATMPPAEYCAVRGIDLGDDPDRATATEAMVRDLLRRQRELDKRTGGE